MSVNSSSSSNDSLLHPHHSSTNDNLLLYITCFISRPGSFIFTFYIIISILLLLPLFIFILYLGLQQWKKKPSTSSAAAMSHSDVFTYHMVLMELVGVFGCILCCSGVYSHHVNIVIVGFFFLSVTWYGEIFFHLLTCVERYLAVIHPITYLKLKNKRGIRIRNIIIGCVWLLCFVMMIFIWKVHAIIIIDFCILILPLIIVSFCSLSVLCVLIRPGPGEQGGGRARVDQSKQRAFYTIMVILGVLVVRFSWGLVWVVLFMLESDECVVTSAGLLFNVPSSLLLPLLYLHRTTKLVCWKNNIQKASGLNMQK